MSTKTAYVWGPISNFSGCLLSLLLENGWHLHIATKSALQISLSPLDLGSTAQHNIEKAAGGADKLKPYLGKFVFLAGDEPQRGITYDIALFMGLPSNFDEPRVSRAPWAADELAGITAKLKGVPVIVVSSLWGGIQSDGAVPEEIEFARRKPRSQFEAVCQQYETRVLKAISSQDCKWHLLRLPLVLGSSVDGRSVNFTGLYKLLEELYPAAGTLAGSKTAKTLALNYNPHATFWMLPSNWAASLVLKLIEDSARPVICNVVSTQATLNQEWIQELALALSLDSILSCEKDSLNLPPVLRSMLVDNIQVKTRNLFEVLGRHQRSPMVLTSKYFAQLISYACAHNWGQIGPPKVEAPFSPEAARSFFETFLPAHLQDRHMLKALGQFRGGIALGVRERSDCLYLLSAAEGRAVVTPLDPDSDSPQVSLLVAAQSFASIVSGKIMFELALASRALQVNGAHPLQNLKACDFFRRFLMAHHYIPGS
jgi:hypothetical protein